MTDDNGTTPGSNSTVGDGTLPKRGALTSSAHTTASSALPQRRQIATNGGSGTGSAALGVMKSREQELAKNRPAHFNDAVERTALYARTAAAAAARDRADDLGPGTTGSALAAMRRGREMAERGDTYPGTPAETDNMRPDATGTSGSVLTAMRTGRAAAERGDAYPGAPVEVKREPEARDGQTDGKKRFGRKEWRKDVRSRMGARWQSRRNGRDGESTEETLPAAEPAAMTAAADSDAGHGLSTRKRTGTERHPGDRGHEESATTKEAAVAEPALPVLDQRTIGEALAVADDQFGKVDDPQSMLSFKAQAVWWAQDDPQLREENSSAYAKLRGHEWSKADAPSRGKHENTAEHLTLSDIKAALYASDQSGEQEATAIMDAMYSSKVRAEYNEAYDAAMTERRREDQPTLNGIKEYLMSMLQYSCDNSTVSPPGDRTIDVRQHVRIEIGATGGDPIRPAYQVIFSETNKSSDSSYTGMDRIQAQRAHFCSAHARQLMQHVMEETPYGQIDENGRLDDSFRTWSPRVLLESVKKIHEKQQGNETQR